ncbi:CLUMA_CG010149, isoform A [Clunio marinus]|uniref:CLUMA_CG010149, isoform A n=1 Tax=Clunio marinus TaxID=568069 RepID=A0A1J1I8V4_9DIPT|nr:CLUMA_CG010149, isoform A [Clunio marinus]
MERNETQILCLNVSSLDNVSPTNEFSIKDALMWLQLRRGDRLSFSNDVRYMCLASPIKSLEDFF